MIGQTLLFLLNSTLLIRVSNFFNFFNDSSAANFANLSNEFDRLDSTRGSAKNYDSRVEKCHTIKKIYAVFIAFLQSGKIPTKNFDFPDTQIFAGIK